MMRAPEVRTLIAVGAVAGAAEILLTVEPWKFCGTVSTRSAPASPRRHAPANAPIIGEFPDVHDPAVVAKVVGCADHRGDLIGVFAQRHLIAVLDREGEAT